MVLDKTSRNLPKLLDARSTRLDNVQAGLGKTQISEAAKRAERAYFGQFAEGGIIASGYQDHGVGINLMDYRSVSLIGYAYGPWVVNNNPAADRTLVSMGAPVEQDAIAVAVDLNTPVGPRSLYRPQSGFRVGQPHIFSKHAYLDYAATVQLVVWQANTSADVFSQTGTAELLATGEAVSGAPGVILRPKIEFIPTKPYLKFMHTVTRTSGGAGQANAVYFYNPLLEQVQVGQHQPSKFVVPKPGRAEFPANALEGNALKEHISGLEVTRVTANTLYIGPGSAYIPGLARVVNWPGAVNSAATMNTSNRHYYVYLYEDASGNGAIEVSATGRQWYSGNAWHKSGDATRRYLGAINNTLNPGVRIHDRDDNLVVYADGWADGLVAAGLGNSSGGINVNCSPFVPPYVRTIYILAQGYGTSGKRCAISYPGGPATGSADSGWAALFITGANGGTFEGFVRCDSNQDLRIEWDGSGCSLWMYVRGYLDQR